MMLIASPKSSPKERTLNGKIAYFLSLSSLSFGEGWGKANIGLCSIYVNINHNLSGNKVVLNIISRE